jgi:hypothetical protein
MNGGRIAESSGPDEREALLAGVCQSAPQHFVLYECRSRHIPKVMPRIVAFLLLSIGLVISTHRTEGRNRLTILSTEQTENEYYVILRRVFHRLYDNDIVVAELFAVGSGDGESAAGVLKTAKGYRAFALFSSPGVWKTELPRFLRGMKDICVDDAGKEIQCPPESRPKTAPREYHRIKIIMKTRLLSTDLAARIESVWQQRVREALRLPALTDDERGFVGGFKRYYSVRLNGRDWSTVLGQTGGENTDTEGMATLANALTGYALGTDSEKTLRTALRPLEAR